MDDRKIIIPPSLEKVYDTFHYAPGILIGDTLHVSGQVGRDADLNVVEDAEAQIVQAFENTKLVLDAAGATFDDVYELESWFTDMAGTLKTFMTVKDRYFVNRYPTWTGFQVAAFSMPGIICEIKVTAHLG